MSPRCSDSQANEREYVLNVLEENDYPKRFLNDCLRSPVCRNQNNSEGDTSVKGYAIVPYIQGVTEPIKRILSNCNIKIVLKPYLTLGHIFAKPKDPVKTLSLLSVIRYDLGAISFLTFAGYQFAFGSVFAMTWSPLLNLGSDAVCWS